MFDTKFQEMILNEDCSPLQVQLMKREPKGTTLEEKRRDYVRILKDGDLKFVKAIEKIAEENGFKDDVALMQTHDTLNTVIHQAAELNLVYAIFYFRRVHNVSLDQPNLLGWTALQLAIIHNNYKAMLGLIKLGALLNYINEEDPLKPTALHLELMKRKYSDDAVHLMVNNGASLSIPTSTNKTAIDLVDRNTYLYDYLKQISDKQKMYNMNYIKALELAEDRLFAIVPHLLGYAN